MIETSTIYGRPIRVHPRAFDTQLGGVADSSLEGGAIGAPRQSCPYLRSADVKLLERTPESRILDGRGRE